MLNIGINLMDCIFANFRWYRKLRGGHWERWYVDSPVNSILWFKCDVCIKEDGAMRPGLCRGTPVCETY